MIEKSN